MLGDHPCAVALLANSLDEPGSRGQVQTKSVQERADPNAGQSEDPLWRELLDFEIEQLDRRSTLG